MSDVRKALEAAAAVPEEHEDCVGVCAESPMSGCKGRCLRAVAAQQAAFLKAMPEHDVVMFPRKPSIAVSWTPQRILAAIEEDAQP